MQTTVCIEGDEQINHSVEKMEEEVTSPKLILTKGKSDENIAADLRKEENIGPK